MIGIREAFRISDTDTDIYYRYFTFIIAVITKYVA